MGIDPGSNVMGYGVIRCVGKKAEMVAMGVIDMRKEGDPYLKLGHIYARVTGIIDEYLPDEIAIEAPFYGKNVQSMLKLGRAQGVAMVAALNREIPITEYEPRKIKMAITGNGAASKEQVAMMLQRTLGIDEAQMPDLLDATDALAAALCHFYERNKPFTGKGTKSWKSFIAQHPDRVKK
jgi:crossover junction endodeoxyribonuclease RuvC